MMSKRKRIKAQELARLGNWQDVVERAAPVERPVPDSFARELMKRTSRHGPEVPALAPMPPYLPYIADSDTSREAADAVVPRVANYREQVYKCIAMHGPCTDEEIADRTGLNPSTARPRRVDLMRMGRVRASEQTKRTRSGRQAQAWTVTTPAEF